jgi:hypothetical protein
MNWTLNAADRTLQKRKTNAPARLAQANPH